MRCEICYAELSPNAHSCSVCGVPVMQNVEGFDNTIDIQRIIYTMMTENFNGKPVKSRILQALLMDYLADYKAECRLLIYSLTSGVLQNMLVEENREIAVMRARTFLLNECFISKNAAEFVLACLTYILKWEFTPMDYSEEIPAAIQPDQNDESVQKKSRPVNIDALVFRPLDAVKYKLSKHIVLHKDYTKIDGFAFDKFNSMRSIKLPGTLIVIEEYAFSGCKHLRTIELPDSLRIIRQGAFSNCSELESIKIPHGVLEIEENTFLCCESLTVADIPSSVTSIGVQAFSGCEKLKMVYLPDSIKFIDENAFLYCPEVTVKCYENSYAHKYCLNHNINCKTIPMGMDIYNSVII